MVWATVTKAGGEVTLDTAPGAGTTVKLTFPCVSADAPGQPSRATVQPIAEILMLEDQADVARLIVRILSNAGHAVDAVSTTQEAVERIAARRYGLFISDGQVPDGPVTPAIEAFRRRHPHAPIILCSGYVENADVLAGIAGTRC
jgi:CheY-like chemotaxis protein